MITMTTSSSSRVKPRCFSVLAMTPPVWRPGLPAAHVLAQRFRRVLAAGGVRHHERRAQQHLARRAEAGPGVVAELEVRPDRAAVVADGARAGEDMSAVHQQMHEAVATVVQL